MDALNPYRYDNAILLSSFMEGASKKAKFFIPLHRTELHGHLSGPVSEFSILQTFSFTKEECPDTIDAIYRFPLPGDAAIDKVKAYFGEVEVETKLMERKKAEEEFDSARKEGKQSMLMTRETLDVFTMFLAGIRPGEDVKVLTSFVQVGDPQGVGFEYRIPLTTSPRYVRSDEAGDTQAKAQPLLPMIDPGHRFTMDVEIVCQGSVECASFETLLSKEGHMSLKDGEVVPDRDLVFRWTPVQGDVPTVQVLTDGDRHFMAVITPPKRPKKLRPREITLLLDRSGSMAGAKWDATTWAAERLLRSLRPEDRFNLCLFHSTTRWLFARPGDTTPENLKLAREFLKLRDSGGTELGVAIEQALDQPTIEDVAVKHVIIVTDAEVSDAGRIVQAVKQKRGARRCSVICIDSAPNSFLARKIAQVGEGAAKFLTSSPAEEDLATALDDIMEEWMAPLSDVMVLMTDRVAYDSERGEYAKAGKGKHVSTLPPMPSGRSMIALGSFKAEGKMGFKCTSTGPNGEDVQKLKVNISTIPVGALGKLFGAAMLNKLELLASSEADIGSISEELKAFNIELPVGNAGDKIYRENRTGDVRNAMRQLVVETSLRYNVPCAETAFLGIRNEKGDKATTVVIVPNALGQGWDDSFAHDISPSPKLINKLGNAPRSRGAKARSVGGSRDGDVLCCMASPSPSVRNNILYCLASSPSDMLDEPSGTSGSFEVIYGVPTASNGAAILLDGIVDATMKLSGLISKVTILGAGYEASELLIFVGDMSTARVRIRLRDMEDGTLVRPINIQIRTGERIVIKLVGVEKTAEGLHLKVVIN